MMPRRLLSALLALVGLCVHSSAQCMDWLRGGDDPQQFGGAIFVHCLAAHDDGTGPHLYAAGQFDGNFSGVSRWEGDHWAPVTTPLAGTFRSMVSHDGGLVLSGSFTQAGGIPANNIAAWRNGRWEALASGLSSPALAMVEYDGQLVVAGDFLYAGGMPARHVASWDGTVWAPLGVQSAGGQASPVMAYDSIRRTTVLVGTGVSGSETWEWAGAGWRRVAIGGPPSRTQAMMTFDSARGVSVLFGGLGSNSAPLSDTWEWDGAAWRRIDISGPSARSAAAMCYDSARRRVVLNGGRASSGSTLRETWEYDGIAWSLASTGGLAAFSGHAMVFDSARMRSIAYANSASGLWGWDGLAWTRIGGGPGVVGSSPPMLEFDSVRSRLIYLSGIQTVQQQWEWDGSAWQMTGTPGEWTRRSGARVAFDSSRGTLVLYGGFSANYGVLADTREFDGSVWRGFGEGTDRLAESLAVHDDGGGPALFVGGQFQSALAEYPNRIFRFRNGSLEGMSGGIGPPGFSIQSVKAMCSFQGRLCVGGIYTLAGGAPAKSLSAWDGAGWSPIDLGQPSGTFTSLAIHDGAAPTLIVSGLPAFPSPPPLNSAVRGWDGASPIQVGGRVSVSCGPSVGFPYGGAPAVWIAGGPATRGMWVAGGSCVPPTITTQPRSVFAVSHQDATFTIDASGSGVISFQWRFNGQPLSDSDHVSGTATRQLVVHRWSLNDQGFYDCVVSNIEGSVTSAAARLTVAGGPPGDPRAIRPIAWVGDPAPDRPGRTLGDMTAPRICSGGQVAFLAGGLLVYGDADRLSTVFVPGDPLPGLTGFSLLSSVQNFGLGLDGALHLQMRALDSGVYRSGAWSWSDGRFSLHAFERTSIDGIAGQVVRMSSPPVGLGSGAQAFQCALSSPGAPNREVLVDAPVGAPATILAEQGGAAPGLPGFHFEAISLASNDAARTAPGEQLLVGAIDRRHTIDGVTESDAGLWVQGSRRFDPVALRGDRTPDGPPGRFFSQILSEESDLNDEGAVLFTALTYEPPGPARKAVYESDHGRLVRRLAPGDDLLGRPVEFCDGFCIDRRGNALVAAWTLGAGGVCCDRGLYLIPREGVPELVSPDGSAAFPGFPPGPQTLTFNSVAMNERGMVVIDADLSTFGAEGSALLGWTRESGLFTILLYGTQFEAGPGLYRTLDSVGVGGAPRAAPYGQIQSAFTDSGTIAARLSFSDGTVNVSTIDFTAMLVSQHPCAAVIADPADLVVREGETIHLDGLVSSAGTPVLSWLKDGSMVVNDERTRGAERDALIIEDARRSDGGEYQLAADEACGSSRSLTARVTVLCRADLNRDGSLTPDDYTAFLACYEDGECLEDGSEIDITRDGFVDFFDYDAFVEAFESGC